jgi:hypothetical protein
MRRARLFLGTYMQDVRRQRNMHLTNSDWTQNADSPLTDAKKQEWATYRQALRDFPANVSNYSEDDEYIYFPDPPDYVGDVDISDIVVPTPTPEPAP